jgi:hypothetical protein
MNSMNRLGFSGGYIYWEFLSFRIAQALAGMGGLQLHEVLKKKIHILPNPYDRPWKPKNAGKGLKSRCSWYSHDAV